MNRGLSGITVMSLFTLVSVSTWGVQLNGKVNYIRKTPAVPLEVPAFEGQYYNDLIPDTLDIADRAAMAINMLTENTDPQWDYEIYFSTELYYNPPFTEHNFSDWCGTKFWEALPLMRLASGSRQNRQVDPVWLEVLLRSIGPDGLFYIPLEGRPWARRDMCWGPQVWRSDGTTTNEEDPSVTQIANPMPVARAMHLLIIYSQMDHRPAWRELIERMIDRSLEIAVDKGDYGYIPEGFFEPNARIVKRTRIPMGVVGVENYARMIQGPANYYRLTGYEPARELASKLVHGVRYQGRNFSSSGKFLRTDHEDIHFHSHVHALVSMMDYAIAVDDRELMGFIAKCYEWARSQGNSTVGFFPEFINPKYPACELCDVADMIAAALKLSQAGAGDYWDDADRWTRNQFSECQLTKIDWIDDITKDMKRTPVTSEGLIMRDGHIVPAGAYTDFRVPERSLGCFAGWAGPNDWGGGDLRFQHCCAGNASRTLYYIWEHILDYEEGHLRVNLLLNRASSWADVYSSIPYVGEVRLKIKQPCTRVSVRVPEWVTENSPEVQCRNNGQDRAFQWRGRYLQMGQAAKGDIIHVTFPLSERIVKEKIAGKKYTLVIRGNTVISIDPPGKYCPLYQPKGYKPNQLEWRAVTRFVSETVLDY